MVHAAIIGNLHMSMSENDGNRPVVRQFDSHPGAEDPSLKNVGERRAQASEECMRVLASATRDAGGSHVDGFNSRITLKREYAVVAALGVIESESKFSPGGNIRGVHWCREALDCRSLLPLWRQSQPAGVRSGTRRRRRISGIWESLSE